MKNEQLTFPVLLFLTSPQCTVKTSTTKDTKGYAGYNHILKNGVNAVTLRMSLRNNEKSVTEAVTEAIFVTSRTVITSLWLPAAGFEPGPPKPNLGSDSVFPCICLGSLEIFVSETVADAFFVSQRSVITNEKAVFWQVFGHLGWCGFCSSGHRSCGGRKSFL